MKIVIIDSNAIVHRSFHALPPLTAPDGSIANAVYGFTSMLIRMIRELEPDYIVATFDMASPTFRHVAYERYKAQRPKGPDELYAQIPKVKEVLSAFHIPVLEKEGYEADDIIGTLAKKISQEHKNAEVIIVTGDLDTLQLVTDCVRVYTMKKGVNETILYDEAAIKERYGLIPAELTDYKGLRGDPSDNIPGVKGIGEKTASELLQKYHSIEEVYRKLKKGELETSESIKKKLAAEEEEALFSKELATINQDVPIDFSLEKMSWGGVREHLQEVETIFKKFGFRTLWDRLQMLVENAPKGPEDIIRDAPSEVRVNALTSKKNLFEFFNKASRNAVWPMGYDAENHNLHLYSSKEMYSCSDTLFEKFSEKEKEVINSFFANNTFLVFNAKPIFILLERSGIAVTKLWQDFLLAEFLLDAGRKEYSFERTIHRVLNKEVKTLIEALPLFAALEKRLTKELKESNLQVVYETIELPLTPILAGMESRGIKCEKKTLADIGKRVNKKLELLTKKIYQVAGEKFNINSPRQLGEVLFVTLKIGGARIKKTKTGQFATAERELVKLKNTHPIIADILSYRELMKLKTTYIDALPALIASDGRLHTTFNQIGTSTGRLASENPNVQNIPIRSEIGREIRQAFVAEEGWNFLGFDYSQLELRIAASLSEDKKMIQAFRDGVDIHRLTASEINNIPLAEVTHELRQRAKTFNFGILYGMGPRSFAEGAGISMDEAKAFPEEYFHDFSLLAEYLEKTKEFARNNGYVETAFGRRRYLPNIVSPNIRDAAEAERMAINMPIQGTAADIIKLAMIQIDRWVRENKLSDSVRMLLQIHDELIFEVKENIVLDAKKEIKKIMESVWKSPAPIVVDVFEGNNWAELK